MSRRFRPALTLIATAAAAGTLQAQTPPPATDPTTLPVVRARAAVDTPSGKDSVA